MEQFRVAAVFSNHMVLQREKGIRVFGTGRNGEEVVVELAGQHCVTVVEDGKWLVVLPARKAEEGLTMKVSCKEETVIFTDVAIGEVWLAGGQSNMEFELHNSKGGEEALKNDKNPRVRFYYTQKESYMDQKFYEDERNTSWSEFGEQEARTWSAVGYYFGRKLAKDLGVTVGIIGCNWGGTSASAWMSMDALTCDQELNTYVDEYEQAILGKTEEEQIREYREYEVYQEQFQKKIDECYSKNPEMEWEDALKIAGECQWPGPMNCINPFRPAGLYQCMLKRVMPYSLRGFLYYQGESDDHKPRMYYKLFTRMIQQWRDDWEEDTLPFLMVQLPMHRYKQDPDYKNWCLIREAQMKCYQTVRNTGIAVILDLGQFNEIHPQDKVPVGERLELQALNLVYHKVSEDKAFGPIYKEAEYLGESIRLSFLHAEDGFEIKDTLSGFEIAGSDKVFVQAEAEIEGSKITVLSKTVKAPRYVRYCWTNYGPVTLYGKNGLPMAPFRTSRKDEAVIDDKKASVQQIMEL